MFYRIAAIAAVVIFTGVLSSGCAEKTEEQLVTVPPPPPSTPAQEIYAVEAPPPAEAQPASTVTFEQPAAVPITAAATTYTVVKGDTLWSIARKVYGDGQRWQDIAAANGITDAKKLRVGQELILP